jgi:sucrose-6F-phosphate phosphohydrolase
MTVIERTRQMLRLMKAPNIRLFSTDLDGTLLGNPDAAARFMKVWDSLRPGRRPLLVYNTGRSIVDTRALTVVRDLPEPDFIIGSVGTELHDSLYNRAEEFGRQFGEGWSLERVKEVVASFPGVEPQPADCHHQFKSSWFWARARREELELLKHRLGEAGVQAHVDYSCRYFLDIVPARAGKGRALAWLCQRLHIPLTNVLVAGDTGNDASMFLLPGVKGIVVENALPELLSEVVRLKMFVAQRPMADGVIEGLRHYGVISEVAALADEPAPAGPLQEAV